MSDPNPNQQTEPEQPVVKQLPYMPKSQGQPVDTLIPVNMQAATTRALNTLEQQVGQIDVYVADRLGYGSAEELHQHFSAEQVDASALALSNLEKQSGFIIGDQTGVGKGRVVAAMIRYAKATGHTPIFVTQNPALYADIMRDLRDIGLHDFKPFPTNSDLNIPLSTQQILKTSRKTHEAELQSLIKSGSLGDYDGIFTTYSQMQSVKGKETLRRDFLRAFASNAILVMDESHVAGGTKSAGWSQSNTVPNQAEFARELIERSAGVFYSSATYAKRPDVMDLYAKTDMRLAVKDIHSLVSMIETGGVPMQQALAAQLTEAGQYVRRERSYEGVNFNLEVVPVNREIAEQISATLAGILEFDRAKQAAIKELDKALKAEAKAILGDNAVGQVGVESVNFTAVMHNLIDQTLLAMKAEATVQKALELLRQPDSQKPVIALSSTMGSFIGDYARLHQIKPGDGISLDPGDLLKRYLERSRDIMVGNPYGEKSRQRLTDEQLGPVGVMQYEQVLDQINQTDFTSIPISPIDYIKARLTQAGYRVGEVTGRQDTIDYAPDGSSTYEQRSTREMSKATAIETVRAFNHGEQDVIILNCSGSTGISLHASHQFQDQRQRHMIVVQPEKDINQFMQMLGRIHRTGQVVKPNFTLLNADIPAEKRPAAVLAKKMASLNANTTAARSSGISLDAVTDFMNDYGDQVVTELLQNNPGLNRKLDNPLKDLEGSQDTTNIISRVTGRLPLLPLAEQERVYTMIEREYHEYIQRQEAMGESMLEAQSLDLDARTIARIEVVSGDLGNHSPFTSPVYLEVVDAKTLRKPMTTLEVMNLVRGELDLKPVANPSEHDVEQVNAQSKQASVQTRQTLVQAVEAYRAAAQAQKSSEKGVEKLNTRLDTQLNHVGRTLDTFPVGEPVRAVTETGNIFYGVVGRVWHSAQEAGENPAMPSTWKMQILLADPARQLILPLSQVNIDQPNAVNITPQTANWDGVDIYDVFDQKQSRGREERQIFTGNLLRAHEKFQGKLINYTDNQGQTRQGLLTPQGFDIEESLEKQPVEIPTARQVVAFITEATQSKGQVKTLDETLTVKPQHQRAGDGFVLQTPKPKDLGGQYYLDEQLLRAAGSEFYSIGDRMECVVPKERIDAVLQRVMQDKGMSLAAFEHRGTAREMLGIELPKLELIQRGEFEAKAHYTPVVPEVDAQTRSNLERVLQSSAQPVSPVDQATPQPSNIEITAVSDRPLENPSTRLDMPDVSVTDSSRAALRVAPPAQQQGAAEKNVARLLEQAGLAQQVLQGEDFHTRIENQPFIPLVIERHINHLYLTHYRELNGDLYLDAEMVFQIANTGALALKETAVPDPIRGGEFRGCDRSFAQMFSQNLLHQGFAEAAVQAANATAEPQTQSSHTNVDPALTDRSSDAGNQNLILAKTVTSEAQTTPAQLAQAETTPVRLAEVTVSSVSGVPNHQPPLPLQKDVTHLVAWQQVARALARPESYVNRIGEVTEAYKVGEPVSSKATTAMQRDFVAHEKSLSQLRDWHRAARFLGRSEGYQQRITEVATGFKAGTPVSEPAVKAMSQDLKAHQRSLEALGNWQRVAKAIGRPEDYCMRIAKVVETCKAGCPLSDRAEIAMRQDLRNFQQVSGKVFAPQANKKLDVEIGD